MSISMSRNVETIVIRNFLNLLWYFESEAAHVLFEEDILFRALDASETL